ncbi:hypothetical protein [Arsenophonus sp. PmNCSU2021_1]|uniref:hypothetical protein n=1 Tax=Arsenophonus sp. PmNCSU2021_1 TaxID=3118989 RepID=UPI002FF0C5D5
MTLNQAPHYEAIGHCVFLKEKIKSRIEFLENRLSLIHELGIAPSCFFGNKSQTRVSHKTNLGTLIKHGFAQ